jgi:hypothetical protein
MNRLIESMNYVLPVRDGSALRRVILEVRIPAELDANPLNDAVAQPLFPRPYLDRL